MGLVTLLAISAVIGAGLLVMDPDTRIYAVFGLIAAALQLGVTVGVVHLSIAGVPLRAVLGGALLTAGGLSFFYARAKTYIAAATVLSLVGLLQFLLALGWV